MLVIEGNIPLHSVFPYAFGLGGWIAESIGVGHEKLKDVAPTGAKTGVARCSPGTFFLGNLREAASLVGGGGRISVAVHEGDMIRVAVVVDALKKIAGPHFG